MADLGDLINFIAYLRHPEEYTVDRGQLRGWAVGGAIVLAWTAVALIVLIAGVYALDAALGPTLEAESGMYLLLFSMPVIIVGGSVWTLYRRHRRR